MELNKKAPSFHLADETGTMHALEDFKGSKVVLYFYPKDNTPGCTAQACSYRDHFEELKKRNIQVIGISKDSMKSHQKFKAGFNLQFLLLSDPDCETIQAYDVWKEKKLYGKAYMGVQRDTFVIDEEGILIAHFEKVKPEEDVSQVLAFLDSHQ